jgi:hypothetical protein
VIVLENINNFVLYDPYETKLGVPDKFQCPMSDLTEIRSTFDDEICRHTDMTTPPRGAFHKLHSKDHSKI